MLCSLHGAFVVDYIVALLSAFRVYSFKNDHSKFETDKTILTFPRSEAHCKINTNKKL